MKISDIFVKVFDVVVDVKIATGEERLKLKLSHAKNAAGLAEGNFLVLKQQQHQILQQFSFRKPRLELIRQGQEDSLRSLNW